MQVLVMVILLLAGPFSYAGTSEDECATRVAESEQKARETAQPLGRAPRAAGIRGLMDLNAGSSRGSLESSYASQENAGWDTGGDRGSSEP